MIAPGVCQSHANMKSLIVAALLLASIVAHAEDLGKTSVKTVTAQTTIVAAIKCARLKRLYMVKLSATTWACIHSDAGVKDQAISVNALLQNDSR